MPPIFRANGVRSRKDANRSYDKVRGSARARGYTTAWDKATAGHQRNSPLCRYCETGAFGEPPRVTATALTDHLYPHNGDQDLFWSTQWWVSSCATCHNGPKQAAERRGPAALDALARHLGLPVRGGGGVESLGPPPSGPAV